MLFFFIWCEVLSFLTLRFFFFHLFIYSSSLLLMYWWVALHYVCSVCRKDLFSFRRYHLATRSWCMPAGCHSISFPLSHLGISSALLLWYPRRRRRRRWWGKTVRIRCTNMAEIEKKHQSMRSLCCFGTTLFLFFLSLAMRDYRPALWLSDQDIEAQRSASLSWLIELGDWEFHLFFSSSEEDVCSHWDTKKKRKKERKSQSCCNIYVLIRYVYIYIRILLYMEDIVRTRLWWISSLVLGAMTLLSSLKFQVMGTIYSYYYYWCWVHCILFLLSLLFNNMKGRREPKDIDGPQLCRHPGFFLFEFLRLVVFLFSSTLFFEYYSIPSIVVSDWSPDFLFFFFLILFVWNRIQNGVPFFSSFFFRYPLVSVVQGDMTIEAFRSSSSSPMLFVLHCHHCVCVCVWTNCWVSSISGFVFSLLLSPCYLTRKYLSDLRYAARRLFNQN